MARFAERAFGAAFEMAFPKVSWTLERRWRMRPLKVPQDGTEVCLAAPAGSKIQRKREAQSQSQA